MYTATSRACVRACVRASSLARRYEQEGGRLWEHPFQGRPRVNPTVKRGKEEKTYLLRRHRPSPGRIQDPLYTCIVYM